MILNSWPPAARMTKQIVKEAMKRYVWVIHRPGYGDSDGLPVEIWQSRNAARRRQRQLNEPWDYPGCSIRFRKPFKLSRMELCSVKPSVVQRKEHCGD